MSSRRPSTRPPVELRLPSELGRGVAVEVAGDHVGSGLGEAAHDLGAEPTGGTGHDGPPPAQGDQLGEATVADVRHDHGPDTNSAPGSRSAHGQLRSASSMTDTDADAVRRLLHAYGDAVLARDARAWGDAVDRRRGVAARTRSGRRRSRGDRRPLAGGDGQLPARRPALPQQHGHRRRRRGGRAGVPRRAERAGRRRPPGRWSGGTRMPTGARPTAGASRAEPSSGCTRAHPTCPGSSSAPTCRLNG